MSERERERESKEKERGRDRLERVRGMHGEREEREKNILAIFELHVCSCTMYIGPCLM